MRAYKTCLNLLQFYFQSSLKKKDILLAILHNPKGWECEARSHLGSPLGELCNIVFVYGLLRGLARNLANKNGIENPKGFSYVSTNQAINYTRCCQAYFIFSEFSLFQFFHFLQRFLIDIYLVLN